MTNRLKLYFKVFKTEMEISFNRSHLMYAVIGKEIMGEKSNKISNNKVLTEIVAFVCLLACFKQTENI